MPDIKELEKLFHKVIEDIEEYLPYLVLVGGWVPHLYVKYLWENLSVLPTATTDIDFGLPGSPQTLDIRESIYSRLSRLRYKEKHLKMDRLFPIVPLLESPGKTARLMIEFITSPQVKENYLEKLVGRQIFVNRLEKFDLLLKDTIQINLTGRADSENKAYRLNIPPPHLFILHKALTLTERFDEEKKAKDINYIYFVLRFHPNRESLVRDFKTLDLKDEKQHGAAILEKLFSNVSGQGCMMVELENAPDPFIDDIRNDAFLRFQKLIEALQ